MIKFFRQIRRDLMEKNKTGISEQRVRTGKYLKYAIGEIILVVIGILIALSINNWNEEKRNKKKIITIFKDVQEDLLNDINEISNFLEWAEINDTLSQKIISGEIKKDDYTNNANNDLFEFGTFAYPIVISNHSFLLLTENKNLIPAEYKDVLKDLSSLYEEDKQFLDQGQTDFKNFTNNYKNFIFSQPWDITFNNSKKVSDSVLKFYLSNTHKSKIRLFNNYLETVYVYAERIKNKAVTNYLILNEMVGQNNKLPNEIKNHLVGSLKPSTNYTGTFYHKSEENSIDRITGIFYSEENSIDIIKKNNLLFWHSRGRENIYIGNKLLTELDNDSLQFVSDKKSTLKFQRNSNNDIIGFRSYYEDKPVGEYEKQETNE